MGAVIKAIDKNSPAGRKLRAGYELISVNGNKIIDVLDYKYYTYDGDLTLKLRDKDGKYLLTRIIKPVGADLGLDFDTYLMDEARRCFNSCLFCFVDQLPPGLRESLYFKDDDARLSFLTGNYITLTNLSEREIERIIALRLSPVNVSVHATNGSLRAHLLGNPSAARGFEIIRRLAAGGITMNCQIVCCPGINDGEKLAQTMSDLAPLYPRINSVSVVPVGLTKHRAGLPELTAFDTRGALAVISQVEDFSALCLDKYGSRIFFCADEFYIKAQEDLPCGEYYEGYPQLENGVGMITLFSNEFLNALFETPTPIGGVAPFSVVTGLAAAPFISSLLRTSIKRLGRFGFDVYPVKNEFFGVEIDVAGLLTGRDIIAALEGKNLRGRLLMPKTMLRHGEGVFLDGVTVTELESALGVPVFPVEQDGGAFLEQIIDIMR